MVLRSIAVWLVLIAAEVVHGIARTLLLEPFVGDLRARQIGVFTGAWILLTIAVLLVRWIGAGTRQELLAVGVSWLILTLTFEIAFGRWVMDYSWERLVADYNLAEGGFLGIGMVLLALAPVIAAKVRGIGASHRSEGQRSS